MKTRIHIKRLFILVLGLIFFACGSKQEYKGKIGMTCMDLTNPFFKLIANVMNDEANQYGYEVVALDGANDPAQQNNQLADFVAQAWNKFNIR